MNINNVNTATGSTGTNKNAIEASIPAPAQVKTEKQYDHNKIAGMQKIENRNAENKEKEKNISSKILEKIAEDLNDYMDDLQTDLGFTINNKDDEHQVIVEIKNRKTNEVIKQIPSKELLEIKKKMEELTGLIFDHKV